jgi:coenzyme F420-0:L-glutamate ligase / coenzyme F420-1:gamma-L-glutamate ligase
MPARDTLTPDEARFLAAQRVGHLATADAAGRPHVVPVCYVFDGARFYFALDEKPKRVADARLRRVRNLVERHEASLVVDYYDEDWSRLVYVLIHARAEFLQPGSPGHANAVALLRARYPQYQTMALESRPIIALAPDHVTSWGTLAHADEYASPSSESSGRGVDFSPVARGRRSVRQYQTRAVPRPLIEQILEAARWAPSPHGRQPWRFVVLTRPERRARLAEVMGSEWKRNLEMDGEPPEVVAIRLDKSHQRILQAPVIVIPCLYLADLDRYPDPVRQSAEETMAVQSLGAAIQNMLLAAYSLGLDSGWMCAPLFCPEIVSNALGLQAALTPHALITVGYAASDPVRRPHRPLDELVIHWD